MLYKKMARWVLNNSESNDCSEELLIYGLEIIGTSWMKVIMFLLLGMCIGYMGETVLVLCVFSSLRSQAGGRHCKTSIRCSAAMLSIIYGSILMGSVIELPPLFLVACYPFYFYHLYKYAPLPAKNSEHESMKKRSEKKTASLVLMTVFTIAAVLVTIPKIRGMIYFAYTAELLTLLPLDGKITGSLSCCRK